MYSKVYVQIPERQLFHNNTILFSFHDKLTHMYIQAAHWNICTWAFNRRVVARHGKSDGSSALQIRVSLGAVGVKAAFRIDLVFG